MANKKEKFENVVLLENVGASDLPYKETYLYAGPMSMFDIEYYEDVLIRNNIPYKLVEAETTIQTLDNKGIRYSRGYCLFADTKKKKRDC